MAPADVVIMHFRIDQRCINLRMAQEALHLFHGHPVPEQDGGDGMPEDMRRDPDGEGASCAADDPVHGILDGFGGQWCG